MAASTFPMTYFLRKRVEQSHWWQYLYCPMKRVLTYDVGLVDSMATVLCQLSGRWPCFFNFTMTQCRYISATTCKQKNIRAGVPKITINRNKPLTYEESQAPYRIGVTKSWNSWNTCNLKDEGRQAETTIEDVFIRKFIKGTWHGLFASEVIIKRRHNMIVIAGLVFQSITARKMYFLWGYTEELLSHVLKCPVKLEIQTVQDRKDVVFKCI